MDKKYVKLSSGDVIEATQVSYIIQKSNEHEISDVLQIQVDTSETTNNLSEYSKKLSNEAISDVNVYSDSDCKNLIFAAGGYSEVSGLSANVRNIGLLYSITLTK